MLKIDGSYGEGGGQILRTALALSIITNKPFYIYNIRKGRCKPGLKAQHIHSIKAILMLSNSKVNNLREGIDELSFYPLNFKPRSIDINIGTAGSITLLMQSILLPLILFNNRGIKIKIKGGTDVKWSQPIDYFKEVLLNAIKENIDIKTSIIRRGYYPEGNGLVEFRINKIKSKNPIEILERGRLLGITGTSHASIDLSKSKVAERQAYYAKSMLKRLNTTINIRTEYSNTSSTGSGLSLFARFKKAVLGSDSLGKKGKHSSGVAKEAVDKLLEEIKHEAPVDEYLSDNLIPFLGIFGGRIKINSLTEHTKTNLYITELFLGRRFEVNNNIIKAEPYKEILRNIKKKKSKT